MKLKKLTALVLSLALIMGIFAVSVTAAGSVQSVQLDQSTITLDVGEVGLLKATVTPGDNTTDKVNFTSTDPSVTIGDVVYNDATGETTLAITGDHAGTATIIAISEDGFKTATCAVTVKEKIGEGEVVNHTLKGGTATASDTTSPVAEQPSKAFDNKRDTKWLVFNDKAWIQFQFNDGNRYVVNHYALVSANDDPIRDPVDWEFLGSNDGINWDVLDTQSDQAFEGRKLKRIFEIDNTQAYEYYRLNITRNNTDSRIQLAEIQLLEYGEDKSWALGPFEKLDENNPILTPNSEDSFIDPVTGNEVFWSEKALYNPAAVVKDGVVNVLYRSQNNALTSHVGLATSTDGITFDHLSTPVLYPDNDDMLVYEKDGGCEDPRVVKREDGTYIMTYSAYDKSKARLAVATSTDLVNWTKQGLAFNDAYDGKYKDTWSKSGSIICDLVGEELIAKKIDGKYWMYWGESDLFMATSDDLIHWTPVEDADGNLLSVMKPRKGSFDSYLVEPGPPAIYTENGILLIYNCANDDPNNGGDPMLPNRAYCPGQALFDAADPTQLVDRTNTYFMYPEKDYELEGLVNNVCFVEGLVYFQDAWYLYYGTADSRLAVAKFDPDSVVPVSKDSLNAAIEDAGNLNGNLFTEESMNLLSTVLNWVQTVSEDENATQAEVDEALALLNNARDSMVMVGTVTASTDKEYYDVNEPITITVRTPINISGLRLKNENDRYVTVNKVKSVLRDDVKEWTIVTSVGSKGLGRTLSIWMSDLESHTWVDSGASVTFDCGYQAPSVTPTLLSASLTDEGPFVVNEEFSLTVTTSTGVDKLYLKNERGGYLTNTATYEDEGDIRTWTVTLWVGSAGSREMFISGRSTDGSVLDQELTLRFDVTKS